jgi:hypothetical protein
VEYPLYSSPNLTEEQGNAKEVRNAKRFDLKNFEYYTVQLHNEKIGKSLNCKCPICDGRTIDDIPIDFMGSLTAAFRVHETFAIQDFVSRCLDSYEIGKTFEFLKDSPPVMRAMKDTFQSDRMNKQQMLPTS